MDSPTPMFRNNPEGMKAFQEVVDTLSKDEDYTFPKAGLGSNAIAQIIRKHMDERRRRETDIKQSTTSHSESDASSTSGDNSPESGEKCKAKQLDDYYNKGKIIIIILVILRFITKTNYVFILIYMLLSSNLFVQH